MILLRLLAFVLANGAILLGARSILGSYRTGDGLIDFLIFLTIRLVLISGVVLLAGVSGTLNALALAMAGIAAGAALVVRGAHRGWSTQALPKVGPFLSILTALVAFRLVVQVWFFAPHLGDAVAYHLPKVAEWVRAGAFTREMGLHPHVSFPAGFELVEAWWVVFFRHDALIEAAGLEFLLLGAVATAALGRWAGVSERGATVAGMTFALAPGVHLSATSCLNDVPAGAVVVALAAMAGRRVSWGILLMTLGLGLGIKPTVGFALPGVVLLGWFVRKDVKVRRPAAGLAALGLAIGAFWYARNLLWFGNPFYPLGTNSGYPAAVQFGPSLASLWANLGDLLGARLLDGQVAPGANVDYGTGWGPAASVGLVGIAAGLFEDARLRRLAAAFGLSLTSTLLFVQNDPWCLKYAFYFPALLGVGAAWLGERHPLPRKIAEAALLLAFAATILPYDLPAKDFRTLAAQSVVARSALPLWEKDVPDDAVGCLGGTRARSYLLYRPDFSRRVVYLREETPEGLVAQMSKEGVVYLYAAPEGAKDHVLLRDAVERGLLRVHGPHLFTR